MSVYIQDQGKAALADHLTINGALPITQDRALQWMSHE